MIEYTAPALVVDPTLAAPVVDVPPEGVERAQPAPVAEDVAPAPEIPCPAPTPVADLTDPTPAAPCAAPAPVVESVAPHGGARARRHQNEAQGQGGAHSR